ncbi:hypothetical protein CAPTEDRAFT_182924 [Capitella teleta]|uniref:Outer dense fiber protein 3 n=1 Tax=Capitella teleta TaxID=283909 RepID=R7USP6_CAPTE|nr:hypothetical protein CAPTEDRAFT_182924 [Capitella teleta]|eukprot:ELU06431.1 hypothetical protein CAPTEDRAFT_182924 [Capitella teleta]
MVYVYTVPRVPVAASEKGPGPAQYTLPTLIGSKYHTPTHTKQPGWNFGVRHKDLDNVDRSPGPVYLLGPKVSRFGNSGEPHYSLSMRTQSMKPANYPPPGTYNPQFTTGVQKAPAYTFGKRTMHRSMEKNPAPNSYRLPALIGSTVESGKKAAPIYSMVGRCKIGGFSEDLQKTPGPGTYKVTQPNSYRNCQPAYSMTSRNMMPGDTTKKPGPGAHSPEKVNIHLKEAPKASFGIRHSEYSVACLTSGDIDF